MSDINIKLLLDWFSKNKRDLPWRKTKDPYKIWLSEIMLQQTQVQTVIPYYHRFIDAFPTLTDFANASDHDVMKAWEGLGYYSRVRNMHEAAKKIMGDLNGNFPKTKHALLSLKGFGDYTSASVASLAFGESCVAVDGNVKRLISRLYTISDDITKTKTLKSIKQLTEALSYGHPAGEFNEAMMELGATVCKPKQPECHCCPLSNDCMAYQKNEVLKYPIKPKKAPVPHYNIAVGVVYNKEGDILIALRPKNGLLGNLWEFPGGKKKQGESLEACCQREIREEMGINICVEKKLARIKHAYSHFKITLHAFKCTLVNGIAQPRASQEVRWVKPHVLHQFAFPKANKVLLEQLSPQNTQILNGS